MTSGGAHRRSKVGFKRSGKRHVLHFPALVQRRRMTVWGLSLTADADRVRHRTEQISNIRIFISTDERSRLAERCERRAAAARLQLI